MSTPKLNPGDEKHSGHDQQTSRRRTNLIQTLLDNAHLLTIGLFVASLGVAYSSATTALDSVLLFSARKNASALTEAISAFRVLYTEQVVEKVRGQIDVSHEAFERDDAIPLPATLTLAFGEQLSGSQIGITTSLYSPYPFPWRTRVTGSDSAFKKDAWEYLQSHPGEDYSRSEKVNGVDIFRFAKADIMRESCVGCHNTHPDSPKTDWKVGDVRGILVVSEQTAAIIAEGRDGIRAFNIRIAIAGALGLLGMLLVTTTYRYRIRTQRKMQEILLDKNDELEQFAYRSSHDLKAPLTTMKGLAAFVAEDVQDGQLEEAKINVLRIAEQAERLESLVVDILDLARADLKPESVETFSFEEMLVEVRADVSHSLAEKAVEFTWTVDLKTPIAAQRVRLLQVIENLVTNSIKYSDPEKPSRTVHITASRNSRHCLIIVEDNGVGIPSDKAPMLFDAFSRFHPGAAEGSGLGMAIVKKHVTAMGGSIKLQSSTQGTSFSLRIPV